MAKAYARVQVRLFVPVGGELLYDQGHAVVVLGVGAAVRQTRDRRVIVKVNGYTIIDEPLAGHDEFPVSIALAKSKLVPPGASVRAEVTGEGDDPGRVVLHGIAPRDVP